MASNWAGRGRVAFKGAGQGLGMNPGPKPLQQRRSRELRVGAARHAAGKPPGGAWVRQGALGHGTSVPMGCQRRVVVVDERAGTLNGGTTQTSQSKSHENPAFTHGSACVGRQEVDESQSFAPKAAAVFANMGV